MVKELTSDNLRALTGDCRNSSNNNNKHHHLTFGDVTRMDRLTVSLNMKETKSIFIWNTAFV